MLMWTPNECVEMSDGLRVASASSDQVAHIVDAPRMVTEGFWVLVQVGDSVDDS